MALIKCPECGHEISDKAKICPNCGYSQEKTFKQSVSETKNNMGISLNKNKKKIFIALGSIVSILLVVFICISISNAPYKKIAGKYACSSAYGNYPASIVFEDDRTGYYWWKGDMYLFEYTLSGNKVDMETGYYLAFDGEFTEEGFKPKNSSLVYKLVD